MSREILPIAISGSEVSNIPIPSNVGDDTSGKLAGSHHNDHQHQFYDPSLLDGNHDHVLDTANTTDAQKDLVS
jgi:hypothetical protein